MIPYTEVGLEEIMQTSTDIADPLMNPADGLTDFLLNDLENSTKTSTLQVHHSPKLVRNSEAQTTQKETKDSETQTEESLLGQILRHIGRIAQTTNEQQLKVAVQTQRQNQAILDETKRVERKVTNIQSWIKEKMIANHPLNGSGSRTRQTNRGEIEHQ